MKAIFIQDIRKEILKSIEAVKFRAIVQTDMPGVLAGVEESKNEISKLGLEYEFFFSDGDRVSREDTICVLSGYAEDIIKAEEVVMGKMAKFSGIATAAGKAVELTNGECKIVAGAWKKMPKEIKRSVQQAVRTGGATTRLVEDEFIYLDKNYIQMLGGIREALSAVSEIDDRVKVVQIKGRETEIEDEAALAIENGAGIIMVDTGEINDLIKVKNLLAASDFSEKVHVGFAGDIDLNSIPECLKSGADFLCIGKEIVDAPLLDMKLDVVSDEGVF